MGGREASVMAPAAAVGERRSAPPCDWFSRWVYTDSPPVIGSHAGLPYRGVALNKSTHEKQTNNKMRDYMVT
eukprot:1064329-Pyramimonas_sp.AAC.1